MFVFNAVTSLIRSLAVVDTRAASVPVINKNWFGLAYDGGGQSGNLISLRVRLLLNIHTWECWNILSGHIHPRVVEFKRCRQLSRLTALASSIRLPLTFTGAYFNLILPFSQPKWLLSAWNKYCSLCCVLVVHPSRFSCLVC